jgi:hypothetical protein
VPQQKISNFNEPKKICVRNIEKQCLYLIKLLYQQPPNKHFKYSFAFIKFTELPSGKLGIISNAGIAS